MDNELFRCMSCHRLITLFHVQKQGKCACGGRRLCGAYPVGFWEKLQVFWWELTLRAPDVNPNLKSQ